MSLETLLEAAEFVEWRSQVLGDAGPNSTFQQHARVPLNGSESDESNQTGKTFDFDDESSQEKRRSGGAGTREVHNKLEKNRRAHLKECFDFLKKNIPCLEDKRSSNLGILLGSLRYIQTLKRKEREYEADMQRLAQDKIRLQERMSSLKLELLNMNIAVDLNMLLSVQEDDNETNSTSTATERGTPPPSDRDEEVDDDFDDDLVIDTKSPLQKVTPTLNYMTNSAPPPSSVQTPKMFVHDVRSIKELLLNGTNSKMAESIQSMLTSKVAIGPAPSVPMAGIQPQTTTTGIKIETSATQAQLNSVKMIHTAAGSVIMRAPASAVANIVPVPRTAPPITSVQTTPAVRPPVTQILHRTLTQRQALQKQSSLSSQVVSAPIYAAKLKTTPQTLPPIAMTTLTGAPISSSMANRVAASQHPGTVDAMAQGNISQAKVSTESSAALPVTFPFGLNVSTIPRFAHPILVTSLTAPPVSMTTTGLTQTTASVTTSAVETGVTQVMTSTVNTKPVVTQVAVTQAGMATSVPTSPLTAFPMRPFFASNFLSPAGHFTLPLLAAQTIPQTQAVFPTSTAGSVPSSTSAAAGQVSSVAIMSLAHMNQLSPLMAPITVMSTGMQMGAQGLTQAQLNSMIAASPLLKQFPQLPVVPPSMIQRQILGQQVMKPVVVVSVPNMNTTTATLPSSASIATTTS